MSRIHAQVCGRRERQRDFEEIRSVDEDVYIFVCLLFSLVLRQLVLLLSLFSKSRFFARVTTEIPSIAHIGEKDIHTKYNSEIQRGRDAREHSRGFLFTFLRLRGGNDRNSNRGFDGKHFLYCVFKSVGVLL